MNRAVRVFGVVSLSVAGAAAVTSVDVALGQVPPIELDPNPCVSPYGISPCVPWEPPYGGTTFILCNCPLPPATPCCVGVILSGGQIVYSIGVLGNGPWYRRDSWRRVPQQTVFRAPLCPDLILGECELLEPEIIECGLGWQPAPGEFPCSVNEVWD